MFKRVRISLKSKKAKKVKKNGKNLWLNWTKARICYHKHFLLWL